MKIFLAAAAAASLTAVPAVAATLASAPPDYQTSNGPQQPTGVFIMDANGNIVSSFGGSGGSSSSSGGAVTQGTSPWVDNISQIGGTAFGLGRTTMSASLPVAFASDQAALPVTIGNFPATQPVSGNFYQATQPISGSVGVSNFPTSQAVTGAFYQATQPVSGTFWQATQPVSDTATATFAAAVRADDTSATVRLQSYDLAVANLTGTVAPGTAAVNSLLAGGVYNSTAVALTTGQQASLQMDAAGDLRVIFATAYVGVAGGLSSLNVRNAPTDSAPVESNTAIGTTSTAAGVAYTTAKAIYYENQGTANFCLTWQATVSASFAAPSGGVCAVGKSLAAGATWSPPINAMPSTQVHAIASAAGGNLYIYEQ